MPLNPGCRRMAGMFGPLSNPDGRCGRSCERCGHCAEFARRASGMRQSKEATKSENSTTASY